MIKSCNLFLRAFGLLAIAAIGASAQAREHQIYSVSEEVPMGYENEVLKKNYYVNIGENQGVRRGATLDVFRIVSKLNPYENQKRINHRIKIGELKILHADEEAAIGALKTLENGEDAPLFEIENFMIGDHVSVSVTN